VLNGIRDHGSCYECAVYATLFMAVNMGRAIWTHVFTAYVSVVLRVSWTAKRTNEWILNKAGVKRELLDTVKARKLANYGHIMRKQGSCLEKEIMQGTMRGARRRGRPRTAWMDNIKTWTGLPVEKSIRMREDRDK